MHGADVEQSALLFDREWAHKSIQKQIDSPLELKAEPWISRLQDVKAERFGFVVYRLSYAENGDEWKNSRDEIKAGMDGGWEGFADVETIKLKQALHWIDSQKENIPEGNLDAAPE